MNMMFNAVNFIHRLEGAGLSRAAAETIAEGIDERNRENATKGDLTELVRRADLSQAKSELEVLIAQSASRQTMQFSGMIAVAVAIIGVIVGLK